MEHNCCQVAEVISSTILVW